MAREASGLYAIVKLPSGPVEVDFSKDVALPVWANYVTVDVVDNTVK